MLRTATGSSGSCEKSLGINFIISTCKLAISFFVDSVVVVFCLERNWKARNDITSFLYVKVVYFLSFPILLLNSYERALEFILMQFLLQTNAILSDTWLPRNIEQNQDIWISDLRLNSILMVSKHRIQLLREIRKMFSSNIFWILNSYEQRGNCTNASFVQISTMWEPE